jgi:hypothetical protein
MGRLETKPPRPALMVSHVNTSSRPCQVWLPARIQVQSFVGDIQGDGSFPSGHSGFFTLIAAAAWKEQECSRSTRVTFTVCAGLTALEHVELGAHRVYIS